MVVEAVLYWREPGKKWQLHDEFRTQEAAVAAFQGCLKVPHMQVLEWELYGVRQAAVLANYAPTAVTPEAQRCAVLHEMVVEALLELGGDDETLEALAGDYGVPDCVLGGELDDSRVYIQHLEGLYRSAEEKLQMELP